MMKLQDTRLRFHHESRSDRPLRPGSPWLRQSFLIESGRTPYCWVTFFRVQRIVHMCDSQVVTVSCCT